MNPYAPPAEPSSVDVPARAQRFVAYRDGAMFVVQRGAPLPPVCIKCGSRERAIVFRAHRFHAYPPWALAVLALCLWIGMVAIFMTRKHAELKLPLCAWCAVRWKRTTAAAAIAIAIVALAAMLPAFFGSRDPRVYAVTLSIAIVAMFITIFAYVRPHTISAAKIDGDAIWLRGVDPAAAEAIISAAQM